MSLSLRRARRQAAPRLRAPLPALERSNHVAAARHRRPDLFHQP
jgi:hypothetical protein